MVEEKNYSSELKTGLEKFREYVQTSIDVDGVHEAIMGFLNSPRDEIQVGKIDALMEVFKNFPIYNDHVTVMTLYKKIILNQQDDERALGYQESLHDFVEKLRRDLSS